MAAAQRRAAATRALRSAATARQVAMWRRLPPRSAACSRARSALAAQPRSACRRAVASCASLA